MRDERPRRIKSDIKKIAGLLNENIRENNGINSNPDFSGAIKRFTNRLSDMGYKLVEHVWEESTGNHFHGYFVTKHPEQLETYKLRDFETPDAYHLGRRYLDDEVDWGGYKIDPKYADLAEELKTKYPDFDEFLDLDGDVSVPYAPELIKSFKRTSVPFDVSDGRIYLDIVEDRSIRHTHEVAPDVLISYLDEYDLPIVAKRLYEILGGDAKRWVEYRLDDKSDKSLIDWDSIDRDVPDDPDDWWKY